VLQRQPTGSCLCWVAFFTLCAGSSPSSAQTQFEFESLPELAGGESFAHSIMDDVAEVFVVGSSTDANGLRWPVFWDASAGPTTVDDLPVPVPGFVGAEAKIPVRAPSQTNYASGCAVDGLGGLRPLIWKRGSGDTDWTAEEVLDIPSGGTYEPYITVPPLGPSETRLDTVGTVYFESSPSEATLASKDLGSGAWVVMPLPGTGPTLASQAEDLVHTVDAGLRIIAGSLQTETAPLVPVIGEETAPASFTVVELPLAPGAYMGALTDLVIDEDGQTLIAVGYNVLPGGIDFYRPVVYRKVNGVWSLPLMLQPLPGLRDARPGGVVARASLSLDHLTVVGHSYFEPGLGGHRATIWEIASDDGVMTADLNDVIDAAPAGAVLARAESVQLAGSPRRIMIAGVYTTSPESPGPAATHAFLLTALPPPTIPTTSHWGLLILSLGLLVGATVALRSRPASVAVPKP
jgi:hypothetical protein